MEKVTLPAVTIEVPQVGMVVYVSPKIGVQENKWTCMFTAEIASPEKDVPQGTVELQSFHIKCRNEKEAKKMIEDMSKRLEKGPYPFFRG